MATTNTHPVQPHPLCSGCCMAPLAFPMRSAATAARPYRGTAGPLKCITSLLQMVAGGGGGYLLCEYYNEMVSSMFSHSVGLGVGGGGNLALFVPAMTANERGAEEQSGQ
ncbi:unnamed protein product [Boreogadus saida]